MDFFFAEEGPGLLFGFLFFLGSCLYLLLPFIVWRIWISARQTSQQMQELNARLERLIGVIAPEAAQPQPAPSPELPASTPLPDPPAHADTAVTEAAALAAATTWAENPLQYEESAFTEEAEGGFSFGDEPPLEETPSDLDSTGYRETAEARNAFGFETEDSLPPMEFDMPEDDMETSTDIPWEEEPAAQEEPFPAEPFAATPPAEEYGASAESFTEEAPEEEHLGSEPPVAETPSDIDVAPVSEQENFELEGNLSEDTDFGEEDFSFETEENEYGQDLNRFADVDFSESTEEFELEPSPGAVSEFSWEQEGSTEDELADEDFSIQPEPTGATDDDLASAFDENLNPNIDANDSGFTLPDPTEEPGSGSDSELELELPPDFSMSSDFDLDAELKSSTPDFSGNSAFTEKAPEPPAPEPPAPAFTPPPPAPENKPATLFARCEGCGHKLAYKATLSGKRVRCPACQVAFVLP